MGEFFNLCNGTEIKNKVKRQFMAQTLVGGTRVIYTKNNSVFQNTEIILVVQSKTEVYGTPTGRKYEP